MKEKSLFGWKNSDLWLLSIQSNALNSTKNRDCAILAHLCLSYLDCKCDASSLQTFYLWGYSSLVPGPDQPERRFIKWTNIERERRYWFMEIILWQGIHYLRLVRREVFNQIYSHRTWKDFYFISLLSFYNFRVAFSVAVLASLFLNWYLFHL